MEGQKVDIEQGKLGFEDEQLSHTREQVCGGDHHGDGTEGIDLLELAQVFDQCPLEVGMEWTGLDLKHQVKAKVEPEVKKFGRKIPALDF
jgi:hypothetical protein